MDINSVLNKSYIILRGKSKTYKLDCEIILSHVLNIKNRLELFSDRNYILNSREKTLFFDKIKERENLKPVSKIINKKNFWNFDVDVSKNILIPRPETEVLIDIVCSKIKKKSKIYFLDIGCGSGCISLSLLDYFKKSNALALDVSKDAILNTKINVNKNNFQDRIKILHGDLFKFKTEKKFDLIISNPPYLKLSKYNNLCTSIKLFEPKLALVGDNQDGLLFFKQIIFNLKDKLKLNGYLAFEIGDYQFIRLERMLKLNGFIIEEKYKLVNRQIRCILAKKIKNYTLQ